jgi:hypothetical protein
MRALLISRADLRTTREWSGDAIDDVAQTHCQFIAYVSAAHAAPENQGDQKYDQGIFHQSLTPLITQVLQWFHDSLSLLLLSAMLWYHNAA